jgi:hypothetical protein
MNQTDSYITLGIHQRAEIHDIEELDEWVDTLIKVAKDEGRPFSVQLRKGESTGLLFTVGLDISHLEFYSEMNSPIIVGSCGSMDDEEIITFLHGDEPSEMEKKYFVSMESARQAIERYFTTGERPENISWGDG